MRNPVILMAAATVVMLAGSALARDSKPEARGVVYTTAASGGTSYIEFLSRPTAATGDGDAGSGRVDVRVFKASGRKIRHYRGDVSCYRQDGDTVTVAGVVTKSIDMSGADRTHFKLVVEDGGRAPDMVRLRDTDGGAPLDCSPEEPVVRLEYGDVHVDRG